MPLVAEPPFAESPVEVSVFEVSVFEVSPPAMLLLLRLVEVARGPFEFHEFAERGCQHLRGLRT